MLVSTQLFIGEHEKQDFPLEHIRQRIRSAKKYVDLQHLMIWVAEDPGIYQPIIRICKAHDIQAYLWFPVLADIPGYEIQAQALVSSDKDQRGYGHIGRWEKLGQGDEKFLFLCPNNAAALEGIFQIYQQLVDQVDFDGVFLDRIRYPSGPNGFESLFTCFCEDCQRKFFQHYGEPLDLYRQRVTDFVESLNQMTPSQLEQYARLESLWESRGLEKFFEFRVQNIYDAVKKFSDYARAQHKQVGLDLFTPSLAPFVSQDYHMLSHCCDWIKPMSYCHAIGPAGVPLEIACLIRAIQTLCPQLHQHHIIRFFEHVLGVSLPVNAQSIMARGIPEEFVARELEKIRRLQLPDQVHMYPGFEAVKNPHFSLHIDQRILEKYLASLEQNADGCIASWNLLYIPDENLEIIGKRMRAAYEPQ